MSGTALYAVIGHPIGHSLSPAMMNAAFRALGLDAIYVARDVAPTEVAAAIDGLRVLGFSGANVTVPHKETVVGLLDRVQPEASAIGAVNTIVRSSDGRLVGHNTDAPGLVAAMTEVGRTVHGARALIVGAGGSARAAAAGLAGAGASSIVVLSRNARRSEALVRDMSDAFTTPRWTAGGLEDAARHSGATDLVVHCTPAGMRGGTDAQEILRWLEIESLPAGTLVVDLVYQHRPTPLVERARARGLAAIDGIPLLLHQGALALSLWTGQPAPIDEMRAALEVAL